MSDLNIKVGELLKAARKSRGKSLRDFEKIIGIARGNISNIEQGKTNITLETLEKFAEALDYDIVFKLKPK